VAAVIFWGLRFVVGAIGLGCLLANWRVGLVILFCLLVDFVTYLGGVVPTFSVRYEVMGLLIATVPVGVILALGRDRLAPWVAPTIAAALLALLRGSLYALGYAEETLTGGDVGRLLPGGVALVLTVAVGLLVPSVLIKRPPRN
jgi:hypothetical protein